MSPLPRLLFIPLALLLGTLQVLVAAVPPEIIECSGDCPEDEQTAECFSNCTCSSHAPRVEPPARALMGAPAPEGSRRADVGQVAPLGPDPEPLLDVPKSLRA